MFWTLFFVSDLLSDSDYSAASVASASAAAAS